MEAGLCKIAAYLDNEEMKQFMLQVNARGVGQSGFIREMLGFEGRPRGTPKGKREKTKQPKSTRQTKAAAGAAKNRSSKRAGEEKSKDLVTDEKLQLSLLE